MNYQMLEQFMTKIERSILCTREGHRISWTSTGVNDPNAPPGAYWCERCEETVYVI